MYSKVNKRTIILAVVIVIFTIVFLINSFKNTISNKEVSVKQLDYEKYLDNGIQLSKFVEEKKFLDNIEINQIINQNNIKYTLKNSSKNSVYISNEVVIMIGEDTIQLTDTLNGKIELLPLEEKTIEINYTINQLSQKLGYRIDIEKLSIIKPIYAKYDDNTLTGIVKSSYNGL